MFIEGTKRAGGKILIPVDSIVVIQEVSNYNSDFFLSVAVRDLKLQPSEFQGATTYNEIEFIELENNFDAFTFLYKGLKGLPDETPKEHKKTK